ncbi:MAG: hypothetical protein GY820_39080 [Gammaproteobacteria bacterium]|nr:hypothetical protein [Gammaproteobacteria bacterium]
MSDNVIDRKFKILAVNPCKLGSVYTEEDGVFFCAKDRALVPALMAYKNSCEFLGCGKEHIESIELLTERVLAYQINVECRIPDTETDCEIDRCISGKV